jgi:pectate lyase
MVWLGVTSAIVLVMALSCADMAGATAGAAPEAKYLDAVRTFGDSVLAYGRDVYGPKHTPLFVDGVNVDTHEPVMWKSPDGHEWALSNLGNQQILFRTLAGLSTLSGDEKYREAAREATRYALTYLKFGGYLSWGGHMAYDASNDVLVFAEDKEQVHELKSHYPYYELMWEVDPAETRALIEYMWNGQVIDWANLDFSRHGSPKELGALWAHQYEGGEVFFWGKGLTFLNAGSDLFYAAAVLSKLAGEQAPLTWSKRLAHRYVETRNPKTGIGGYQFSQAADSWCVWDDTGPLVTGDRAQYQYGAAFAGHLVVEGTLFPCYGSAPGVAAQVCELALGEMLGEEGRDFTRWAVEELTAWGRSAYRAADNSFIPMLTDGTSMEGFVLPKDGYFGPKGRVLNPGHARVSHFWAYAMAYRATGDGFMWEMARRIAQANDLGDIGEIPGSPAKSALRANTADPLALLGFLELYRKTGARAYLEVAKRIGDSLLEQRFQRGFFTGSRDHLYARFDGVEPLALLHLVAAMQGRPEAVPAYNGGSGFYSAAYGTEGNKYDEFLYRRTRDDAGG